MAELGVVATSLEVAATVEERGGEGHVGGDSGTRWRRREAATVASDGIETVARDGRTRRSHTSTAAARATHRARKARATAVPRARARGTRADSYTIAAGSPPPPRCPPASAARGAGCTWRPLRGPRAWRAAPSEHAARQQSDEPRAVCAPIAPSPQCEWRSAYVHATATQQRRRCGIAAAS